MIAFFISSLLPAVIILIINFKRNKKTIKTFKNFLSPFPKLGIIVNILLVFWPTINILTLIYLCVIKGNCNYTNNGNQHEI
jgi:hypothetical protein